MFEDLSLLEWDVASLANRFRRFEGTPSSGTSGPLEMKALLSWETSRTDCRLSERVTWSTDVVSWITCQRWIIAWNFVFRAVRFYFSTKKLSFSGIINRKFKASIYTHVFFFFFFFRPLLLLRRYKFIVWKSWPSQLLAFDSVLDAFCPVIYFHDYLYAWKCCEALTSKVGIFGCTKISGIISVWNTYGFRSFFVYY